jgi:VWFA-related protein
MGKMSRPVTTAPPVALLASAALVAMCALLGVRGAAEQGAPQAPPLAEQPQQPRQPQQRQPPQPQAPAAPDAAAQQSPPAGDQPPRPTFRAGINFVRVDVIVTDKNGQSVGDLEPPDFQVTEDGKPQKIETFRLIKLDGGITQAIQAPPREIRTDDDEEEEASREDVRLFAIFLDDYHVRRGASMAARAQLAKFVETQLGPSDMVGVMYPLESTGSVRMTRNHSAVVRALEQFLGRKYEYQPKNQYEESYAYYPTETVERIRNQVSLSALRSLIVHMGSLKEGRKALIVVSEGYTYMVPPQMRNANAQMPGLGNPNAFNPNAGVNDPNEDRASWLAGLDMDTDLREIYDTANRNNVALYTVDPRGLPGFEFDINENVGFQLDRQYLNATIDSLRVLAENSDGRAIVNRNDLAAGMQQITRDSSAYYLIGYSSTEAPTDGKFHEIKVRLKRPGLQVRARRGYWAWTPEAAARATAPPKTGPAKPVEAALNAATTRPSSAAVVRTWIGTSRGQGGKTRVTFVWEPIVRGAGDAAAGRTEAAARVTLMAVGADGSPFYRGKVEAAAGTPAAPGSTTTGATSGASVATRGGSISFEADPGKMQIRLSAEGASSQVLDTETREISVPDFTGTDPALGTPAVLRARTLRDYQQLKADAGAVPVATREFNRTDRIAVRVPVYGPGGTTPALSVHLLNRGGQAMIELPAGESPTPGERQIEVPLSNLAAGEYVLEIKTAGEGSVTALVGFRITG